MEIHMYIYMYSKKLICQSEMKGPHVSSVYRFHLSQTIRTEKCELVQSSLQFCFSQHTATHCNTLQHTAISCLFAYTLMTKRPPFHFIFVDLIVRSKSSSAELKWKGLRSLSNQSVRKETCDCSVLPCVAVCCGVLQISSKSARSEKLTQKRRSFFFHQAWWSLI